MLLKGFQAIALPVDGSMAPIPSRALAPGPAESCPAGLSSHRKCPETKTARLVTLTEWNVSPPEWLTQRGCWFGASVGRHRLALSQSFTAGDGPPVVTTAKVEPSGDQSTSWLYHDQVAEHVWSQRGEYQDDTEGTAPRSTIATC